MKMLQMMRFFFLFVTIFVFFPYGGKAQQLGDGDYPDFKRCFDVLTQNRLTYNRYNDSIFIIKEHDQWVSFFRHRALKNHQIFASNKEILRTIDEYFAQDRAKISPEACKNFYECLEEYY